MKIYAPVILWRFEHDLLQPCHYDEPGEDVDKTGDRGD